MTNLDVLRTAETSTAPGQDAVPAGAPTDVLYVQERFPVLSETFVVSEIEQLRDWGVRVSVATSRFPAREWGPDRSLDADGGHVHTGVAAHLHWLVRAPRRYVAYLGVLARAPLSDKPFVLLAPGVARVAAARGVQHVHTHFAFRAASVALGVATLLGRPRTVTTHANDIFVGTGRLRARLAGARVLTISKYNQAILGQLDIPSRVNHCGVDGARLPRASADVDERTTDLLFVGRMVAKKGPLDFLDMVRVLQTRGAGELRVRMVGDGPLRARAEAYAAQHSLPVEFTGALAPGETLAQIQRARVLCLPCRRAEDGDLDGIPVVLMEAMSAGTSVVSTKVSGIPELVGTDAGWLVDADGDGLAAALADAVLEALDPAAARTRSARAVERIHAGFTLEAQARGVLEEAGQAATRAASPEATLGARRRRVGQLVATALYLGFARHLPWGPRPGGGVAKRIRRALAERMLDECGEQVNVEHGAWFGSGRGIRLGDRSDLGMDALIMGPLTVGADVMMGPRCVLISLGHATHETRRPMNRQGFVPPRPIVIEDDVWIGAGVTVLPGVRVGRGSVVGAGSTVTKDVPPWSVAAGNPARVVRQRKGSEP
jgi:maltose O-acetyltransferase